MMTPTQPKVLTRAEVGHLLGTLLRPNKRPLSVRSVNNWMNRGLPRLKIGGLVTFREDEVRRWIEAHREGTLI
ncbi:MAG: helix-turn-helix transcriptional regulator [Verrucomicrobiota bacterium]